VRAGAASRFAKYKTLATYVAIIVDLDLDRASGRIKVPRAFVAVDSGQIINRTASPTRSRAASVQSTSWTLHEQVRFDKAGILSQNWTATRS